MELISRTIIREKDGREVPYKFQTYSFIFNEPKERDQAAFLQLRGFMREAFMTDIPKHPKSPSQRRGLVCKTVQYGGADRDQILELTRAAQYHGQGANQHATVQSYFLANDPYTIATELPVWSHEETGSIDLLRYFPSTNIFQILDFKPGAAKEKHVSGQLHGYMELFYIRTLIPYHRIQLIYFDDENVFQVIP